MAVTTRVVDLPRSALWAAFCEGYRYAYWVVGTNRVREVEPGFPAPGTALHYRLGWAPFAKDGETRVVRSDPGTSLDLEAQGWPVGKVFIRLVLEGDAPTRVSIDERPSRGPMKLLHNPLLDALIRRRNRTTLRRLEEVAADVGT